MTATTHVLAGRGRRLVATAIDALLVPLLTVFLVMVTDVVEDVEDYQTRAWILHVFLLAVLSYLLLNGYLLATRAQTIGKWAMGIAIVLPRMTSPHSFTIVVDRPVTTTSSRLRR